MVKWKRDLGEDVEIEYWFQIWETNALCFINTTAVESNYKLLMQWYMVPQRSAKFAPTSSANCFCSCQ